MNKRVTRTLLVLSTLALLFLGLLYSVWYRPLNTLPNGAVITVGVNSSLNDIINQLDQKKITRHPYWVKEIAQWHGYARRLRYGQYHVRYGQSAQSLFNNMVRGLDMVTHSITFIPGWTFQQVFNKVESNPNLRHSLKGASLQKIKQVIGYSYALPEGLFYPDTYHFKWGNSDVLVLKMAYQKMQQVLNKAWQNRASKLPFQSAYQALIAASLIQTEVLWPQEKPIVASVIVNRLKKHMRLQIDTTVLFAMKKPYGTRLLRRNLSFSSPFNTYRHKGLPPAPIALPSKVSILAALHPANTNYLFYVAKGDGSHVFSSDYKGQLKGVRRYRRLQKKRRADKLALFPHGLNILSPLFWQPWWYPAFSLLLNMNGVYI